MESWISKEDAEEIESCRRCPKLLRMEDLGGEVYVECAAEDRFDCPELRRHFSEEEVR
jgi:hypothetical protein